MTRTFDCVLFNDEHALLEVRLALLDPVVDIFVIVEANRTHMGDEKPLHLRDGMHRYERHRHKIRHIIAELPSDAAPRVRERLQHAAIKEGLTDVGPDDVVLIGDVDEIPRPSVVRALSAQTSAPVRLEQQHAIYFANWHLPTTWIDGTMAARGSDLDHPTLAVLLGDPDGVWNPGAEPMIADAGWHLSYLGGPETISRKMAQIAHVEHQNAFDRSIPHLRRCVRFGVHFDGGVRLRRLARSELDPELADLCRRHEELFDFHRASGAASWLYHVYVRLATPRRPWGRLLRRAVSAVARRPAATT